jgi:uncharacterized FlaG/YvyC family protein
MDAALAPRAYHTAAPVTPRAEVTPVRAAVPTLLPQPNQSVAASVEHQASRFDGNDGRPRARSEKLNDDVLREIEREMEFNEDTKDLVSKTLDKRTGVVLQQYPAETLLKLRAYVRAESARTADPEPIIAREA